MEFIKLNIDKKLNLNEIAQEYKITSEELQKFHNSHCAASEFLPLQLLKFVDVIYLPKSVYNRRVATLLPSRKLTLPNIVSQKKYGVIIKSFPKKLQIHYTLNISRSNNNITIERDQIFVNNKAIDKTIEQLIEKAQTALFPITLQVNSLGEILEITNKKEILEKWNNTTLPKLKEYYVGEKSTEILQKISNSFEASHLYHFHLQKNLFFKLFFAPIYQSYPEKTKGGKLSIYNFTLQGFVNYDITYFLQKDYTRGNKIMMIVEGTEEDNYFNIGKAKGQISFTYKLHKETHEIFSVTGSYTTYTDHQQELKVNFEMYEL